MPKDATKNIDRYKIKGGHLNEFDFHQNQENLSPAKATKGTKENKLAPMRGASAKKLAARKAALKKES